MAGMTLKEIEEATGDLRGHSHHVNPAVKKAAYSGMENAWHDLWDERHDDDGLPTCPLAELDRLRVVRQLIVDQN